LDLGSASFGTISQAVVTSDPSFMALSSDRAFLYSVNEGVSTVSAFSVNATNGNLTFLNQKPSNGGAPAHIVVDASGRNVLVANYDGGSVTVFPIQTNGTLGTATAHIQHPGSSPHAHCVTIDASNHFAFVCDKGLNQVRSYVFDPVAGTLTTNATLITSMATGSGPRHMVFDPQCKRAYVICETTSTIVGFNYDATNGILTAFQTVSTLPPGGFSGNTTAEIAVHPSGRFVYGSNRGYNSIVVYAVDQADGRLTPVQQQTTGATPRSFAIDPTGSFCIVAGQNSNDIRLYTIDQQSGLLTDTGKKLTASLPVCVLPYFLRPPQPVITVSSISANRFEISLGNSLNLLTYQLYRATVLSPGMAWDLLTTGEPGQTNFVFTNILEQEYFQVGVLTNY
jgi:6-phosphogluconolactonase